MTRPSPPHSRRPDDDPFCGGGEETRSPPDRAFGGAEIILLAVLKKADFWKKHAAARINERQRDIINRLLDGFEGKLTSSKWALIEKCSQDSALRDITELVELGILQREEAGAAPANSPGGSFFMPR
jgi:hypothetical protein